MPSSNGHYLNAPLLSKPFRDEQLISAIEGMFWWKRDDGQLFRPRFADSGFSCLRVEPPPRFTGDDALIKRGGPVLHDACCRWCPCWRSASPFSRPSPPSRIGARAIAGRSLVGNLVPETGQQVRQLIDGFVSNAGNLTAVGVRRAWW